MQDAPKLLDRLTPDDAEHFAEVRALLDDAGLQYEIVRALVRGIDYYDADAVRVQSGALGAQSGGSVAAGRYDRLMSSSMAPRTPASGWAAGVERILLASGELPVARSPLDLFVAVAEPWRRESARRVRTRARRPPSGLNAQLELTDRSLKGQLKHADRLGTR